MFRVSRGAFFIIPIWALAFGGCSASNYSKPVNTFFEATKEATKSFNEYDRVFGKRVYDKSIALVVANPNSLRPRQQDGKTDCTVGADHCRLVVSLTNQEERELFSATESPGQILMSGLVAYAGTLVKIADDKDAGEIETAANAAKTNLIKLAKATDALGKVLNKSTGNLEARVTAAAGPITAAASHALGKYADAVKLEALRRSTEIMEGLFPPITEILKLYGDAAMEVKRDQAGKAYRNAFTAYFAKSTSKERIEAYLAASKDYNDALEAKPEIVFTALQGAHSALVQALRNPDISIDTIGPYLHQVATEAEKLVAITKALQKVGKPARAQGGRTT